MVAAFALAGAACGDDEDAGTTATTAADAGGEATTTSAADTTETTTGDTTETTAAGGEASGEVVEITAVDYAFEGVPETVAAGTKFSLTNSAETEPHEFVAFLVPEGEERPIDELVQLPEEELQAIFAGEPATVILAAPGQTDVPGAVVGDGTVTEPGRYVAVCALPVGSTAEALESQGPPEGDGGPPHFTQGMYAEFTVE